jgi:hypothetical protein
MANDPTSVADAGLERFGGHGGGGHDEKAMEV